MNSKKDVVQKLVYFAESDKRESELSKDLVDGWYIANIRPHKNKGSYFFVLEKKISNSNNSIGMDEGNLSLKQALEIATSRSRKNKILQDA